MTKKWGNEEMIKRRSEEAKKLWNVYFVFYPW